MLHAAFWNSVSFFWRGGGIQFNNKSSYVVVELGCMYLLSKEKNLLQKRKGKILTKTNLVFSRN